MNLGLRGVLFGLHEAHYSPNPLQHLFLEELYHGGILNISQKLRLRDSWVQAHADSAGLQAAGQGCAA
eukprot:CAMPEP_0115142826 /NCGR_PEP_ID=MMETSP0227-20121206/60390_1 /TAXON_ID=89957 /ORGANISM="Polarella glacialis, Strain CCMP 1383" /LENGTH=67 /DNA_ID=CAMNT_0002551505 /DNA_START=146 /DNA_END=349 /DNA_ORIENTATION=-